VETGEDEIPRLITRIFELRSKINSQIDRLNKAMPLARDPLSGDLDQQEPKVEEELRRLLKINYCQADRYRLPSEEDREDWRNATMIHWDRLTRDELQCRECKHKEGLEEVLNILAVCGFIRREEEELETGTLQRSFDYPNPLQDHRAQTRRRSMSPSYY